MRTLILILCVALLTGCAPKTPEQIQAIEQLEKTRFELRQKEKDEDNRRMIEYQKSITPEDRQSEAIGDLKDTYVKTEILKFIFK